MHGSLSTSKAARKRMTAWRNEHTCCFWAVKLDVRFGRSLGCFGWYFEQQSIRNHPSRFCWRSPHGVPTDARDGVLQIPTRWATWLRGSAISATSLSAFRSAAVRAVWSRKLPMTNTSPFLA